MKKEVEYIIKLFFSSIFILFPIFIGASKLLPLQPLFLGGDLNNYVNKPFIWSFANFDGAHYLSIAHYGYKDLQYFFFPLYPLLIKFVSQLFSISQLSNLYLGILISNISLLFLLFGLYYLVKNDFDSKVAKTTLILLLLFPTSFYFHLVYTESLFLALTVWSLYFIRKKRWLLSGLLVGLASATRVVGLSLIPVLLVEMLSYKDKKELVKKIVALVLSISGFVSYLLFLYFKTGDYLAFFHNLEIYGSQRSTQIVSFLQVFYRYIFKILPNINYLYLPVVFTTWLEFLTAFLFLLIIIIGIVSKVGYIKRYSVIKQMNWSYFIYLVSSYIIPTLSGSFSSFPRYALSLFPGFIILSIIFNKLNYVFKSSIIIIFSLGFIVAYSLFSRGYWVS